MDTKQHLEFSRDLAVRNWVSANPLPVPLTLTPVFAELIATLENGVEAVQQADRDWLVGITDGRAQRGVWWSTRDALHTWLLRVKKVARLIDRTQPGTRRMVSVPPRTARAGVLLTAARSAVQAVTPQIATFVQYGLPSDALNRMTQLIAEVETITSTRTLARQRRVTARAEVARVLQVLNTAVQSLDVLIRSQCDTDPVHGPVTVEAWARALDVLGARHRLPAQPALSVLSSGVSPVSPPVTPPVVPSSAPSPSSLTNEALPAAA